MTESLRRFPDWWQAANESGSTEALARVPAVREDSCGYSESIESLAEEVPVALVYNGSSHAVMMATPKDLGDFAVGFSLSEGLVGEAREIELVDCLHLASGISLQMLIPQHRFAAVARRDRKLGGRTGCGLCGTADLEAAIRPVRTVASTAPPQRQTLLDAFSLLHRQQPLNAASGAVHAAGLLVAGGALIAREDVGRHNAVDKVLGAAIRHGLRPCVLLVTSRASYELVHKAAQLGCTTVAAISGPTAMAVRIAEQAGVNLVGFAREDRMTIYHRAV